MSQTIKKLQRFFAKERYDKKRFQVKVENRETGEIFDIDTISDEGTEIYLVINTEKGEKTGHDQHE